MYLHRDRDGRGKGNMVRHYCVAGRVLEIRADFENEETEETERFRTRGGKPRFRICFEKAETLEWPETPDISMDPDSMVSVHMEKGEPVQIFHEGICGEIFARTELNYKAGYERIRYLKREILQFENMRQCFRWIGIENIYAGLETVILHAALVEVAGWGILFMGPSGVGKSTRADLWKRYGGADIINGDRVFVNRDPDGGWKAYGSPCAGSSGYYVNRQAPARAVVVIVRGGDDEISLRRLKGAAAFREIYKNTALRRWNAYAAEAVSLVIAGMVREVPVYEMISPPDIRAVELLRKELWTDG